MDGVTTDRWLQYEWMMCTNNCVSVDIIVVLCVGSLHLREDQAAASHLVELEVLVDCTKKRLTTISMTRGSRVQYRKSCLNV